MKETTADGMAYHISNLTVVWLSSVTVWVKKAAACRKYNREALGSGRANLQLYSPGNHQTGPLRIEGRDLPDIRRFNEHRVRPYLDFPTADSPGTK